MVRMTVIELFDSIDFITSDFGDVKGVEEKSVRKDHFNKTSSDRIFFDDHNCRSYDKCCEETAKDPRKTSFDWVFANLNPMNQQKLK